MVKRYLPFFSPILRKQKGFTLIELTIVALILGILATAVILLIAPQRQFDKVKDAQRKHDLQQIKTALDTYYQDYNCYPQEIPFGSEWKAGTVVYMKEVPEDPDCTEGSDRCYRYQIEEGSFCPQWHVLYVRTQTKLASGSTQDSAQCPLSQYDNCTPQGGLSGWSCVISGEVDCSYVIENEIPALAEENSGSSSPTPTSAICEGTTHVCTPNGCNVGNSGGVTFCSQQACEEFCSQ